MKIPCKNKQKARLHVAAVTLVVSLYAVITWKCLAIIFLFSFFPDVAGAAGSAGNAKKPNSLSDRTVCQGV